MFHSFNGEDCHQSTPVSSMSCSNSMVIEVSKDKSARVSSVIFIDVYCCHSQLFILISAYFSCLGLEDAGISFGPVEGTLLLFWAF